MTKASTVTDASSLPLADRSAFWEDHIKAQKHAEPNDFTYLTIFF